MGAGATPAARIGAPDILLVEDSPTLADLFVFALQANKSCATIQIVHDGAALRQGANAYIRKPAGFKDACAAITRIEHDWLQSGAANP